MKREAYVATLTFVTVLLLGELDNAGSTFGLTKPLWIGAASWIVWLLSHYTILASLILSVVTSFSALSTGTPSRIVPPTVLTGIGALFYLANGAVEDVMTWFNYEHVSIVVDGVKVQIGYGTVPEEYRAIYYACNAVPFWLFMLTIIPYSFYTNRLHRTDKADFAARGIRYDGAEQQDLAVDAAGPCAGAIRPLAVMLRGDRHGSSLPGLYSSLHAQNV